MSDCHEHFYHNIEMMSSCFLKIEHNSLRKYNEVRMRMCDMLQINQIYI